MQRPQYASEFYSHKKHRTLNEIDDCWRTASHADLRDFALTSLTSQMRGVPWWFVFQRDGALTFRIGCIRIVVYLYVSVCICIWGYALMNCEQCGLASHEVKLLGSLRGSHGRRILDSGPIAMGQKACALTLKDEGKSQATHLVPEIPRILNKYWIL